MTDAPWLDPDGAPADDVLAAALGPAFDHWRALEAEAVRMGGRPGWRWDGPKAGWVLAVKRAGRPFLTLLPEQAGARALVILGASQVSEVAGMTLSPAVRSVFESAHPYPDGRWLAIPLRSAIEVADVAALLAVKLPPTVRARLAGG